MKKSEMKNAAIGELIVDLVISYARSCMNENSGGPTKQVNKHLDDLEEEFVRRGVLTVQQVEKLNK